MGVINNNWATEPWCKYAWCVPTGYEAVHTQLRMVTPGVKAIGVQVRMVAYNITQMRILWEIKTDGLTANNYTASTEASSDKAAVNVKSDIVEKYWEAATNDNEWLQLDAGSGKVISMDTFALIAHNLTGSAVVTLKGYGGSGDSAPGDWSVVDVYATLTMPDDPDEDNLIYISPALPTESFRHWRIDIDDPTNDDPIRIGRVVGGSALIFNGENCLDSIGLTDNSFKDEQQLNGFTSIANNRALKKRMALRFRNLDRVSYTNYRLLRRYMRYCRDTLKALVIVDPATETSKYQFTVFSKLSRMPDQEHRYVAADASYTTLELDLNEGR